MKEKTGNANPIISAMARKGGSACRGHAKALSSKQARKNVKKRWSDPLARMRQREFMQGNRYAAGKKTTETQTDKGE